MPLACVRWRSIGKRYTADAVVDVCLQAATTTGPNSEGGIDRAEFFLSVEGGAPITVTANTMEQCEPAHSSVNSLVPGATAGKLASFPGYRASISLLAFGQAHGFGTITITARVISGIGTITDLDIPLYVCNDSDGGDRRPSAKNLFVDPVNGNDANLGTSEGQAYRTLGRALQGEMGGSNITLMPGTLMTGGPVTPWKCSNGHWVTITGQAGALISRDWTNTAHWMYPGGYGAGNATRMHIVGVGIVDLGFSFFNDPNEVCEVWLDGCIAYSSAWTPQKPWSIKSIYLQGPLAGTVALNSPGPNARALATNCLWLGMADGPNTFYSLQDCVVTDFLAIAINARNRSSVCNTIVQRQRSTRDVAGRVNGSCASSVVSVPAAGQMRIDATAPLFFGSNYGGASMDYGMSTLSELIGTNFVVRLDGFAASANNGSFSVLSSGTNGSGFPYVVLSNPNGVAGASGAGASMMTTTPTTNPPGDLFHPDLIYFQGSSGAPHTNTFVYGLVSRDLDYAQTFFNSDTDQNRLCMWNCRDGGNRAQSANMGSGNKIDCLFIGNTIAGLWPIGGAQTGSQYRNNVVGGASGWSAPVMDSNHFINGAVPVGATNSSTGSWFAGDPTAAPWDYTPASLVANPASALVAEIVSRRWPGAAGPLRGCLPDTGKFDWTVSGGPPPQLTATIGARVAPTTQMVGATGLTGVISGQAKTSTLLIGTTGAPPDYGEELIPTGKPAHIMVSLSPPIFSSAQAVTPGDILTVKANAIYTGGGDVNLELEDGSTVLLRNMPAGLLPRLRVARVLAQDTTATGIVALF